MKLRKKCVIFLTKGWVGGWVGVSLRSQRLEPVTQTFSVATHGLGSPSSPDCLGQKKFKFQKNARKPAHLLPSPVWVLAESINFFVKVS